MIEFDTEYACSIKALGVKENNQIKPSTRFFSGKNDIEFVYIYQILTDTGSTALQFLIVCNEKSIKKDQEHRDLLFEVI